MKSRRANNIMSTSHKRKVHANVTIIIILGHNRRTGTDRVLLYSGETTNLENLEILGTPNEFSDWNPQRPNP